MTREHLLTATLDEIRAVRWTCPDEKCKTAISFPLDRPFVLPYECPGCHRTLVVNQNDLPRDVAEVQQWHALLRSIRDRDKRPTGSIALEFTEPPPRP